MRKLLLLIILIVMALLIAGYFIYSKNNNTDKLIDSNQEYVVKLINADGENFVESAGYYEGYLNLTGISDNKKYTIFVCSQSWDWVKVGSCYKYNDLDVKANVERYKFSMELSGCYVGLLEETPC